MSSDVWGRPGRFVKFTGELAQVMCRARFTAIERGIVDFVLVQVMAVPDETARLGVDTSVRRLAKALGAGVSGVERALRRLMDRGVVVARRHERGHGRRRYHLAHPSLWGAACAVGGRRGPEWEVVTVWPGESVGLEAAGVGPHGEGGVGSVGDGGVGLAGGGGVGLAGAGGVGPAGDTGVGPAGDGGVGLPGDAVSASGRTATRARVPESEMGGDGRESSFVEKRSKEGTSVDELWMKLGGRRVSLMQAVRQVATRLELVGRSCDVASVQAEVERVYGQWWNARVIAEALKAGRLVGRSEPVVDEAPAQSMQDLLAQVEPGTPMAGWIAEALEDIERDQAAFNANDRKCSVLDDSDGSQPGTPMARWIAEAEAEAERLREAVPLPKGLGAKVSPEGPERWRAEDVFASARRTATRRGKSPDVVDGLTERLRFGADGTTRTTRAGGGVA